MTIILSGEYVWQSASVIPENAAIPRQEVLQFAAEADNNPRFLIIEADPKNKQKLHVENIPISLIKKWSKFQER